MRCRMLRYLEEGRAAFSASRSVRVLHSGHVRATNSPAKSDPWLCMAKSLENGTEPTGGLWEELGERVRVARACSSAAFQANSSCLSG